MKKFSSKPAGSSPIVRADYLAYTAEKIDWYAALDRRVFGYEPPNVMLLHDSQLNADTIETVISLFEQRGYKFVGLAEALKDPAYAVPETYITRFGPHVGIQVGTGASRKRGRTQ